MVDENKSNENENKGMTGKINILLPNGQYHVEINDEKGNILAYIACNEEDLEALE